MLKRSDFIWGRAMKQIMITGNAGNDAQAYHDVNGKEFVSFQVAVKVGQNKKPEWIYVNCYDREAKFALDFIRKGAKVLVIGVPSVQLHIPRDGKPVANQRIFAYKMELLAAKPLEESQVDQGIQGSEGAVNDSEAEFNQGNQSGVVKFFDSHENKY